MTKNVILSWPDRFALIEAYNPTDTQVCEVFNIDQSELDTARAMLQNGTFAGKSNIDTSKFVDLFKSTPVSVPTTVSVKPTTSDKIKKAVATKVPTKKGTATTHKKSTDGKPQTATKKVKVPQKRGRKGDKIARALQAVPTSPVSVEMFMKTHGISLAVLRQSKRFISKMDQSVADNIGVVFVRQDKSTKQLMIWREKK